MQQSRHQLRNRVALEFFSSMLFIYVFDNFMQKSVVSQIMTNPSMFHLPNRVQCLPVFIRLDALALSVIAMATWLAGWLAGWVSVTAGIVSKRLNLSENFLDHLVGPSFKHLGPLTPIPNSTGNPFIGGVKYTGVGKLAIFVRFSTYIAVYLGNGAR